MQHNSPLVADEAAPGGALLHAAASSPLVLASANAGKLRELRSLLADLPFEVRSQAEFGVPAPEETGSSFYANALLKARHAQFLTGAAVLADDSGLEVDALGGAPGVYSARYAGIGADDGANNAKLLRELLWVPPALRTARYRCVIVFLGAEEPSEPLVAEGVWEGAIATAPRGAAGFGYDPVFLLPDSGLTAAQLAADVKNRLSHRSRALRGLQELLAVRLGRRQPRV